MLRRTFALSLACQALYAGRRAVAQPAEGSLPAAVERFGLIAQQAYRLPAGERASGVNHRINQFIDYRADVDLCGRDCWQTPAETLDMACGDCEDYAIAKYFLLGACGAGGCPRLVYASWQPSPPSPRRVPHMVLIADATDEDPEVLDCLDPALQRLSRRTDLRPVFSFDAVTLWRGVGPERLGHAAERLWPWRGVLARWARQQREARLAP